MIAPATGIADPLRKVHPLTLRFRHVILEHDRLVRHCRFKNALRDNFVFSASFAVNLAGNLFRLRYHGGTRVCSVTHVTQVCAVWSRRLRDTSESMQVCDLKFTYMQEDTTRNVLMLGFGQHSSSHHESFKSDVTSKLFHQNSHTGF